MQSDVVVVRKAFKSFKNLNATAVPVLQGLDLTLPKGQIYGLLGPSGCGKTTLLRCIVGRNRLDLGTVQVFGHVPGSKESGIPGPRLGFMPQDLALFGELSVLETLQYYGGIAGMSKKEIKSRGKFLAKLLELPDFGILVQNLSGGQSRRVSFAVALLYEPPLLVLDEPTVGVDPVLRQRIWNFLFDLVNETQTSVIITTHYIEEARKSHRIGLMYKGCILAEDNPEAIIVKHQCATLERVFLKLCQAKSDKLDNELGVNRTAIELKSPEDFKASVHLLASENRKSEVPAVNSESDYNQLKSVISEKCQVQENNNLQPPAVVPKRRFEVPGYMRLWQVFRKNIIKSYRNPGQMILQIFLPTVVLTAYSLAMGQPVRSLHLSIVNQDNGNISDSFLSLVDPSVIIQHEYPTFEEGIQAVRNGDSWGLAYIPTNYSDALVNRYKRATLASDFMVNHSIIRLYLDETNLQVSYTLFLTLLDAFEDLTSQILTKFGIPPLATGLPVAFSKPIYGDPNQTTADFIIPGCTIVVGFFCASTLTVFMLVLERRGGNLERDFIAGVTSLDTTLGLLLCQFIVTIFQSVIMTLVMVVGFKIACYGSPLLVVIFNIVEGMCGMALGMLISSACEQEMAALIACVAWGLLSIVVCGILWPLEGMPPFLAMLSRLHPETPAVEAIRSVMGRGWDLTYPAVYSGLLIAIGWLITFFVLSVTVLRFKSR